MLRAGLSCCWSACFGDVMLKWIRMYCYNHRSIEYPLEWLNILAFIFLMSYLFKWWNTSILLFLILLPFSFFSPLWGRYGMNVSVHILCLSAGRSTCGRLPKDRMCRPHSSHQKLFQGAVHENERYKYICLASQLNCALKTKYCDSFTIEDGRKQTFTPCCSENVLWSVFKHRNDLLTAVFFVLSCEFPVLSPLPVVLRF